MGRRTKLEAYFHINAQLSALVAAGLGAIGKWHPTELKPVAYEKMPCYYTWNPKVNEWVSRARKTGNNVIGRLTSASPREQERYYLRVLLKHLLDATCDADHLLKRGPDLQPLPLQQHLAHHATFRDAALGLGLMEDDQLALKTFEETVNVMAAPALRRIFVILHEWMPMKEPKSIWERYSMHLSEDYLYDKATRQQTTSPFGIALARASALRDLHRLCRERNIDPTLHLPTPQVDTRLQPSCKVVAQEMQYDAKEQQELFAQLFDLIQDNQEQLNVWDAVLRALNGGENNVIYDDGPASAGKTTLYNCLLAYLRSQGKVALPHAFSGIAAQQLVGGKTVHSRSRLPVPLPLDDASCGLSTDSDAAELMRVASLIVWDDGPNAPLAAFEAVDRFLRELLDLDSLSGTMDPNIFYIVRATR